MKNDKSLNWETLASRIVVASAPIEGEVPYGFATKVITQWRAMQRDAALRRWSFISLRAALGSAALCGLVAVFNFSKEDSPILFQPPTGEFLTLPLSSR